MGLYEELEAKKAAGEELSLDDLTKEHLYTMFIHEQKSDYLISQLFNVKESKITYRRKKYGISIRNSILDDYLLVKTEHAKEINKKARAELLIEGNVTMIAKAITHFAFRNGPVEGMHAHPNNQLSEKDMETLNKFMVNRLAYIFKLIIEERWIELDFLIRNTDKWCGNAWDEAIPDDGGTRKVIELMLKK